MSDKIKIINLNKLGLKSGQQIRINKTVVFKIVDDIETYENKKINQKSDESFLKYINFNNYENKNYFD